MRCSRRVRRHLAQERQADPRCSSCPINGLTAKRTKADAGQRFPAVQERGEPVEGGEEVDGATRIVMISLGMCRVDAVRVVRAIVPMEPEAFRAWPQEKVVRIPDQAPRAAIEGPGLDEGEMGGRESAPPWVRDRDDDRLWAALLARDIDMAQVSERAFNSRDPLVELLRAQARHACREMERCSAAMSRQILSLSAGDTSRRVTASSSPSISISALSGIR